MRACKMNRTVLYIFCLFYCLSCFISCDNGTREITKEIYARYIIESENSLQSNIQVFIEGSDGNAVTGAVVLVSNSQKQMFRLAFDSKTYTYNGTFPIPADGQYFFEVISALSETAHTITIPHTALQIKPVITAFQDSASNSVLEGKALKTQNEVQLAWNSLGEDIAYVVSIKTPLQTVQTVSTYQNSIIIPANSLAVNNNYYVEITAQKIYGDPLFKKAPYYSVSVARSMRMEFRIE